MTRTCIIVSPYFPPSTLAGVHRARHLAKHVIGTGWTPIVVCVDEAFHEERLDPGLAALVPGSIEIVKVPALDRRYCRPFGLGDISLRAWRPLRQAVLTLLATRRIDAVFITGSPYYPMLLAVEIKRRFGVPVVLDFQDPWVSAWGAALPRWSKGGVAHRLSEWLEPKAVRAADFITSVSDTQNAQLVARYPWLDASRMAALPIGGDPADYDALRGRPLSDGGPVTWRTGQITLAYVGTFMPRTGPVMESYLQAFAAARARSPSALANIRLLFVGTSNQPNDTATHRVLPMARRLGLEACVEEIPQRLPYLDAIAVLSRADGILLIGSDEPHYTASKIYPGLMSGRPWLSLFHGASSAHRILSDAGGGITLSFSSAAELDKLTPAIGEAVIRLATAPQSLGHADPSAYEPFTARAIARSYAKIFESLRPSASSEQ